jgi:hypothetical protein
MKILVMWIALLTLSNPARAFTLIYSSTTNKSVVGWKKNNLTFDIDTTCSSYMSTVQSALDAAAEVWNSVPTSGLTVSIGTTVTLASGIGTYLGAQAPTGNPTVVCDSSFGTTFNTQNPGTSAATARDSIPGYAGAFAISTDMQIRGALLVLNIESGAEANISTLSRTLVDNVLTHEIGHILGLGHSANKNALMYYATGAGRETILAKDDMDGITYLYPRNELSGSGIMGCATVQSIHKNKSGPGGPDPLAIEFTALLALGFWITRGTRWNPLR